MISGTTRVAAVIGHPVGHSASPALHNAAFRELGIDAVFVAFDVEPAQLAAAVEGFRATGLLGVNVTVPHKHAIVALCDALDPAAAAAGAVNCLEMTNDARIIGHNTDAPGFVDALERGTGLGAAGIRAVLLGGGGAARAIAYGLGAAGAADVAVIARAPARVDWSASSPWTSEAMRAALARADLLVDCTNAALSPATESELPAPIPVDSLPATAVVASLVYHRTPALLIAARARGLRVIDGAGMLVHQAARAFEIWTARPAPLPVMWQAMQSRLV